MKIRSKHTSQSRTAWLNLTPWRNQGQSALFRQKKVGQQCQDTLAILFQTSEPIENPIQESLKPKQHVQCQKLCRFSQRTNQIVVEEKKIRYQYKESQENDIINPKASKQSLQICKRKLQKSISIDQSCERSYKSLRNFKLPKGKLTQKKHKQQNIPPRQQRKSTSVGCLFFKKETGKEKIQLQSRESQISQKPNTLQFICKKNQKKIVILEKTAINYPILQTNKQSQQTVKNHTRHQYKSQQETLNVSPHKKQRDAKLSTFRSSQSSCDKSLRHQKVFLRPRNDGKTKKNFSKKVSLLPPQQKPYFTTIQSAHVQKLNEEKIGQLLKPIGHVGQKLRSKLKKSFQQVKSLNSDFSFKSKDRVKQIILTEDLKIKNKRQLTSQNRKTNAQEVCSQENSSKNIFLKTNLLITLAELQRNKSEQLQKQISISIFQLPDKGKEILKEYHSKKSAQKFISKYKKTSFIDRTSSHLQADSSAILRSEQGIQKPKILLYKAPSKQDIFQKILRKAKRTKSQLPKIELFYQNQSEAKVKRTFQSSKLVFGTKKQP